MNEPLMHIPLDRAMLCIQCNQISESGPDRCPACTDAALIPVQTLIEHATRYETRAERIR